MIPNLKFNLLSILLIVSGSLGAPSSRLESRLARRRAGRQSRPNKQLQQPSSLSSNVQYSTNWAGSVLSTTSAKFTAVTGTFTVPQPQGTQGSASVWVGIDGSTCNSVIWQTGIDFTISSGGVTYDAWYEWYPDAAADFSGFNISAGDVITATVTAFNTTAGIAAIENQTTEQAVMTFLTSTTPLCEQDAEWIVEDYEENGAQVPFANFGTVTFTNTEANGLDIQAMPSDGTIIDIQQNGHILTSVTTDGSSVTIKYTGNAH